MIKQKKIKLVNNSKVLLFTDLHAHDFKPFSEPDGDMPSRLKWILKALDDMLKYAHKEQIEHVFFLGDLFHPRTVMKSIVFTKTAHILRKHSDRGIKFHFLPGNHDFIYNNSESPVVFSELSFIDFASDPTIYEIDNQVNNNINHVVTMPFRFKDEDMETELKEIETLLQTKADMLDIGKEYTVDELPNVLLGHFEVAGAVVTDEYILPSQREIKDIIGSSYKYVFSGHVHRRQVFTSKNKDDIDTYFQFLGTPIQHNFGDGDHFYGFSVYDFKDSTYEMIDMSTITTVPEFVSIRIHSPQDVKKFLKEYEERITLDYFRLYVYKPNIKLDKIFKAVKFYRVEPMFGTDELDTIESVEDLQFSMDLSSLIDVFITRQESLQNLKWLDKAKFNIYLNKVIGSDHATS